MTLPTITQDTIDLALGDELILRFRTLPGRLVQALQCESLRSFSKMGINELTLAKADTQYEWVIGSIIYRGTCSGRIKNHIISLKSIW